MAPSLVEGVALAASPLEDLLPLVRRHSSSFCCFDCTSSRLESLALTDPNCSFGLRLFLSDFFKTCLLYFLISFDIFPFLNRPIFLMKIISQQPFKVLIIPSIGLFLMPLWKRNILHVEVAIDSFVIDENNDQHH